jgi:hypothetical protein
MLTSGVILYAKRNTKQEVYGRIQTDGCGNHAKRATELSGNSKKI